jgi:peroxiredoxin Q/BCP
MSPDSPEKLRQWKAEENLPFTLLSNPDLSVITAWGAWGEKKTYGRVYMGVIRAHWVIDEQGIVLDEQIQISPKDSVKKSVEILG